MMAFVLLTFCLVLGIIFGGFYLFVLRPETREQTALRKRLRGSIAPEQARVGTLESPAERLSGMKALNVVLSRTSGISGPLERMITQSGLKVTVGTLLLASALLGCVTYLVVKELTYFTYLGLAAAPFGAMVPFVVVRVARTKRLRLFEEQFPEAIALLARSLRAGHSFPTGLTMVADEIPAPVGSEFKLVHDRQNFGMPLSDALKGLADRVPVLDARFFVTAVLTQRETGGNLSEVLDNLATVIRDRFRVKRQVRVLTAHGRITGWILAGLPPSLAGVLCFISPEHMTTLVTDPMGIQMLAVAGFLQVSGTLIIRKLVDVPY
jgi:tight adherence protein B